MLFHFYANDGHLFLKIDYGDITVQFYELSILRNSLQDCLALLNLKLNNQKTKIMLIKSRTDNRDYPASLMFGTQIDFSHSVKISRVLNSTQQCHFLNMSTECVPSAIIICGDYIKFQRYLSNDLRRELANMFVIQRPDYCNSILINITQCIIQKLQKVFNMAVRFVYRLPRCTPTKFNARDLHWLPVLRSYGV